TLFAGVYLQISTNNGWLGIQVTPASGAWQLTAPAGYTGPTLGTCIYKSPPTSGRPQASRPCG
ncbi:MAG: hypothetical protein NTY64_14710, partial [Deltaproteobacteria bacterium]|nr:hypothetical protein [Deltaproteobacteria bacterium]